MAEIPFTIHSLDFKLPPVESIKSKASDLLLSGAEYLLHEQDKSVTIHETRKIIKRLRALIRFGSFCIDDADQKTADRYYRKLGKVLSETRDHAAILSAFESLVYPEITDSKKSAENALQRLQKEQQELEMHFFEKNLHKKLAEEFISLSELPKKWLTGLNAWDALSHGMEEIFQKSKLLFQKLENPDVELMHKWRRQVKYLQYSIEFLAALWPEWMSAIYGILDNLSDNLGIHHDLEVLNQKLKTLDIKVEVYSDIIASNKLSIELQCFGIGNRLYAMDEKLFVDPISNWVRTYKKEEGANRN